MKYLLAILLFCSTLLFVSSCGPDEEAIATAEGGGAWSNQVEAPRHQEDLDESGKMKIIYTDEASTVCPEIYNPICAQPPMPECPAGMACPQVMPQPKTYSNRCKMEAAGATFLSPGECPDHNSER